MMTRFFYAADFDLHPQYEAYWVVRFESRRLRDDWLDHQSRVPLKAAERAVRFAKRHNRFYDTDRLVPRSYF